MKYTRALKKIFNSTPSIKNSFGVYNYKFYFHYNSRIEFNFNNNYSSNNTCSMYIHIKKEKTYRYQLRIYYNIDKDLFDISLYKIPNKSWNIEKCTETITVSNIHTEEDFFTNSLLVDFHEITLVDFEYINKIIKKYISIIENGE